jgi:hypothetical protein
VAAVLLAVGILLAVPQARAAIINFLQIGDVRLFPDAPIVTLTAESVESGELVTAEPTKSVAATAIPTEEAIDPLLNLPGRTTLETLEAQFGEELLQPTYPPGIGLADKYYFQDQFGLLGIQIWDETADSDEIWAALYTLILNEGAYASKFHYEIRTMEETAVHGELAYWVEGRHRLAFYDENGEIVPELVRLVEGNTLIWTEGEVTYRLETSFSLDEAVKMAESMAPVSPLSSETDG